MNGTSLPELIRLRNSPDQAVTLYFIPRARRPEHARHAPFAGVIVGVFETLNPKVNPHMGTTLALLASVENQRPQIYSP